MISDHPTYVETDPTGRYSRLEEVLGKGAMKTVYRAIDEAQGIEVAWNQVKLNRLLQSPTELQRLYSEVHLLSTLSHPSIIRFHTSWIHLPSKSFNFITELFTSGTLRQYRKKYTRLNMRAIKSWARQILEGLVYLHQHDPPVIHRDLKCDNIFINGHLGQVKIGDLGLAAILRGSHSAHSVIGTPEFMAPELYEEDYNELVDVYSFGMCVLEMLTSEYPYSECTNPAQIYKKVTSGKLPSSFYRIQDFEAQRFIGKCLVCASKRLSAKELLLDPFLASEEAETLPLKPGTLKPFLNDIDMGRLHLDDDSTRTNMNITGKLNPEDDTIFLKVQITDKDGSVRNIYFPFDIISDTPIDVAVEMVKELEIQDWEPFEIADMIDGEISALVPNWKKWDFPHHISNHTFTYEEEDHPFHSFSSCSSSQVSLSELNHSRSLNEVRDGCDWLPDDHSDDTSSESSFHSATYSNLNYFSNDEQDSDHMKPAGKEQQQTATNNYKSTRFCPEENTNVKPSTARSRSSSRQSKVPVESHRASSSKRVALDSYKLTRNKSLVDVRSQLLHRSLVEEVNRRRLFKTVGAVENIGFQAPDVPGRTSHSKSTQNLKGQRSASRRI